MTSPVLDGRYQVVRSLGRGANGEVFLATDKDNRGRPVALKVLDGGEQGLWRSARALDHVRGLDHPNIVRVLDSGTFGGRAAVVTEYVDGTNLAGLLPASATLALYHKMRFFADVARAAAYAHSHGLLHRDIKLSNILVERHSGRAFLADFDIARQEVERESEPKTDAGMFVGTIQYSAPEVLHANMHGRPSDVYSLGVAMYHFLSGRMPFEGSSLGVVVRAVLDKEPPDLRTHVSWASARLNTLVRSMMSRDPAARPPSMDAVAATLMEEMLQTEETRWEPAVIPEKRGEDVGVTVVARVVGALPNLRLDGTNLLAGNMERFASAERQMQFYVDNLIKDYEQVRRQAHQSYLLWLACVASGFAVILIGAVLLIAGKTTSGAVSAGSSVMLFFVQRAIADRERVLKKEVEEKRSHLRAGEQWLRVMQAIEAIEEPQMREARKGRLIDVLITQVGSAT